MPFDATGKWIPEDDSTANKLTGLLATDSKYLTQARQAGTRTANRRGLMNSSIAAGSSEAAAIAAAAPIASQDASQTAQKNMASIEYGNQSSLQKQQDDAAMTRQLSGQDAQKELTRLDSELQLIRQKESQGFELTRQEIDNKAQLQRQMEAIASSDRQALLAAETSMRNTDVTSSNDLKGMYLQAVSNLTQNPKLKAADRNAYIAEFQRITEQSRPLQTTIDSVPLNWGSGTPTSSPAPAPAPAPAAPAPAPAAIAPPTTITATAPSGRLATQPVDDNNRLLGVRV